MKILHIVPSYKPAYIYGGPIESVSKLCEGLVEQGHQVDVFTTTANGETELDLVPGQTVNVDGVQVTYFKRITKDPTHVSTALWKHLYNTVGTYDIVHIQSWWSVLVIVSAMICLAKGAKIVVSPRGMLSIYIFNSGKSGVKKLIHNTVGKRLLAKTAFHATAKSEYLECREVIPNWKGFVLPNIISLPKVEVNRRSNEVFTMVFMSRVHPKKGIELLFKAIAALPFPFKLKIAGSGEEAYIKDLKEQAIQLNISDNIEWLGWVDRTEKFNLLMQSDLFTLVSYNENFANVVIESLHVGTPVLVSYGVALSEFVMQNDMGWVTGLEIEAITKKLTEIYNDKPKRDQINTTAPALIAEMFAPAKLIGDYAANYQQIVANNL